MIDDKTLDDMHRRMIGTDLCDMGMLIAEVRAQRETIAKLVDFVRASKQERAHDYFCLVHDASGRGCNCGLQRYHEDVDAILAKIGAK
jgi:hypothetical protein